MPGTRASTCQKLLLTLLPSIWCGAVEAPQRKPGRSWVMGARLSNCGRSRGGSAVWPGCPSGPSGLLVDVVQNRLDLLERVPVGAPHAQCAAHRERGGELRRVHSEAAVACALPGRG